MHKNGNPIQPARLLRASALCKVAGFAARGLTRYHGSTITLSGKDHKV